jgi:hypothetical protein
MGRDAIVQAVPAAAVIGVPMGDMVHNCPLCHKTFGWAEFQAHAQECIAAHADEVRELEKED